MPQYCKKLFPQNGSLAFNGSFNIIIVAEGYTSAEENLFYQDVSELWQRLAKYLSISGETNTLSLYSVFVASSHHGFAPTQTGSINRTAFETYYDSATQKLVINNNIADAFLDQCIVQENSREYSIKDKLSKDLVYASALSSLVVFLLPISGVSTAEEEVISSSYYYKIATSKDGFYEQAIIRSVGKLIGLGDEYELGGNDYEVPQGGLGDRIDAEFPNLFYLANSANAPNPNTSQNFKWRYAFPKQFNQNVTLHAHPGSINTPDRSLPIHQLSYDKIELWEGGGGYRTKIYRSAYDCLLRRRLADISLPVKSAKVSLCPVCSMAMKGVFY